ncbi:sensor histidine kinase [Mucilaginibacter paludis]|uniref:Oxygen sensor histidine kinase NreB n=1 Tax=Mucilaginibacter paludis DSM 18603 TaxID=714943 RepID=H1Y058_9SPHI|nr:ATP-binding protein [Mucilaginibacter paludis]EHQ27967.1 putative signal transduction histidine kinase [Mucilaginibacter paludis DSM 18603]
MADIKSLIIITTLIFLLAPASIIVYILVYNNRKKKHLEEKAQMKIAFDAEILKTQCEVQEQTMQTIGADLHDNIGQLLSLTSLTLSSVELINPGKAQQKIDTALDLTLQSIKEMRLLGKLLQGDQLMMLGLPEAIRHQINWLEKSGMYQITYLCNGDIPASGDHNKNLVLFRILQETLNNVIKHARATQINISLAYLDGQLRLQINDNGIGFIAGSLPAEQAGMGLQNINKRAAIVGGEAKITSQPGEGTQIIIFIPYP